MILQLDLLIKAALLQEIKVSIIKIKSLDLVVCKCGNSITLNDLEGYGLATHELILHVQNFNI